MQVSSKSTLFTKAPTTRLRVAPNAQAEVVAELPQGSELEVLGQADAFLQVSVWHPQRGRVAGWVHRSFVGGETPSATPAFGSPPQDAPPKCHACSSENWAIVPFANEFGRGASYLALGFLDGIPVKVRVCRGCGLVERCLDKEGRAELEKWLNTK